VLVVGVGSGSLGLGAHATASPATTTMPIANAALIETLFFICTDPTSASLRFAIGAT